MAERENCILKRGRAARCADIHLLAQTKKQNCNPNLSDNSKPVRAVGFNKIYMGTITNPLKFGFHCIFWIRLCWRDTHTLYHFLLSEPRRTPPWSKTGQGGTGWASDPLRPFYPQPGAAGGSCVCPRFTWACESSGTKTRVCQGTC